jgi:molybdate transport system regulatory protein
MAKRKRPSGVLKPRLRVLRGDAIVIGPGKADLLEAIARTGELRRAARRLGMSYMRAWSLLRVMNAAFREPLVQTTRGGARHGAAGLTKTGRTVLSLYRAMERRSLAASRPAFARLLQLLAN